MRYVEEEDLVLTFQNAEQATRSEHTPITREADVMWFVPCRAWSGKGGACDHLPVLGTLLVEVDDRQEIRCRARLVTGPDKKVPFGAAVALLGLGTKNDYDAQRC